jgi:hypothetical protein
MLWRIPISATSLKRPEQVAIGPGNNNFSGSRHFFETVGKFDGFFCCFASPGCGSGKKKVNSFLYFLERGLSDEKKIFRIRFGGACGRCLCRVRRRRRGDARY